MLEGNVFMRRFLLCLYLFMAFFLISAGVTKARASSGAEEAGEAIFSIAPDALQRRQDVTLSVAHGTLADLVEEIEERCIEVETEDCYLTGSSVNIRNQGSNAVFDLQTAPSLAYGLIDHWAIGEGSRITARQSSTVARDQNVTSMLQEIRELEDYLASLEDMRNSSRSYTEKRNLSTEIISIQHQLEQKRSSLRSQARDIIAEHVHLNITERYTNEPVPDAIPDWAAEKGTFGKMVDSFKNSLEVIGNIFRLFFIIIAAIIPWLILGFVLLIFAVIIWRFIARLKPKEVEKITLSEGEG